jgi:hypothetical protein
MNIIDSQRNKTFLRVGQVRAIGFHNSCQSETVNNMSNE